MHKRSVAQTLSVLLVISVLLAGCQPYVLTPPDIRLPPPDVTLPPPDFPQVILTPEYTSCEPAEAKIAELGKIFYDAAIAMTSGDQATYDAKLAEARAVEVPQYKEAMVYKNAVVTGIQLIKMLIDDPGNTVLEQDYVRHLALINEKAVEWHDLACGTDGQTQSQSGQGQSGQNGSGQDDSQGQSGKSGGSANNTGYPCDPVATERFWYEKLAPAHQKALSLISVNPDDTASHGNLDLIISANELNLWEKDVELATNTYRLLGREAGSICSEMKAMFEMWEDELICSRITMEDIYRGNATSPAMCDESSYRHPDGLETYHALQEAAGGLELWWDGIRRGPSP